MSVSGSVTAGILREGGREACHEYWDLEPGISGCGFQQPCSDSFPTIGFVVVVAVIAAYFCYFCRWVWLLDHPPGKRPLAGARAGRTRACLPKSQTQKAKANSNSTPLTHRPSMGLSLTDGIMIVEIQ